MDDGEDQEYDEGDGYGDGLDGARLLEALAEAEDALSAAAAETAAPTLAELTAAVGLLATGCRHMLHLVTRFQQTVETDFTQLWAETDDDETPIVIGVAHVQLGNAREHLAVLRATLDDVRTQLARLPDDL